jgi:hypothetical protein
MTDLGRRLHDAVPPPDPEAEARGWRVAEAAFRRRPDRGRRHRRAAGPAGRPGGAGAGAGARARLAAGGLAAALLVGLVVALTPAGGAVVDLVRPAKPLHGGARSPAAASRAAAALTLPRGTVLAVGGGWATLVERGGRTARLGRAQEATFSAFGRYVALADGRTLTVMATDGRRVWSRTEPARVRSVRWSPDGLRIAYVTGGAVRVVDGNGEAARTVGPAAAAPIAWRPGPEAVLAFVPEPGVLALRDVATGADVGTARPPAGVSTLAWSADGTRLLAGGPAAARLYTGTGARARKVPLPPGAGVASAAFAPRGGAYALVVRTARRDDLVVGRRVIAAAPRLGPPVWSPDGGRVLVQRSDGGWWLLRADGTGPPLLGRSPVPGAQPAGWSAGV